MRRLLVRSLGLLITASLVCMGCGDDGGGGGTPDALATPDAIGTGSDAIGTGSDASLPDAQLIMSITQIIPTAASRQVTTELRVLGANIQDGAQLVLQNCDTSTTYDLSNTVTVAAGGASLTATLAADAMREQGLYTVTVTNPNGQSDLLECAFRILADMPPTVTDVTPSTAYRGASGDGINSDTVVTITGTGFAPTPNVRWVKTDGSVTYDALFVGFGSSTQLTAVVPSETLAMNPGEYHVYVVNPNLLSAQWLTDGTTPGIFTITDTPPPNILDITPARIPNADCTTQAMTVTGSNFDAAATTWVVTPAGTTCAGSTTDTNGDVLCPMNTSFVSATELTITFSVCPGNGAWPITVINPDGQADTFRNVEVRPNNSGHLSADAFDTLTPTLNTARFKHGAEFGFDPFGNSYIYVSGGQDAAGNVLTDSEFTQLDVFGQAGPFVQSMQYQDSSNPRVVNEMTTPRQGAAMVRVNRSLFMIGGASSASDVLTQVAALKSVERARILSFRETPALSLPIAQGGEGLPKGSWYYVVTALGPWGEGLGSREVVALNTGGGIQICWNEPLATGVTGYNIYRGLAADGRAQSAAAIAYEVAGPCFTDDGAEQLAPAPANLRGVVATAASGGSAEGTYRYRVSANLTLSGGGDWQTYASYETSVQVSAADVTAGNNAITLNWDAVPGAVSYSVYRWDDTAQAFRLMDGAAAVTGTSFTDDATGLDSSDAEPRTEIRPLPPGSLSKWEDIARDLNTEREGADAVVVSLEPPAMSPGVIARIIVAGGRTVNDGSAAYLTTAESLGILDDGTFEASWFDETPQFTTARAFYALVTTQGSKETPFPPDPEDPPCGDLDNDGHTNCACGGDDCNDADPTVHPGATEICGDGIDQDCDAGCSGSDEPCVCTTDADNDGHVSEAMCGGDDCCDDGSETAVMGCEAATAPGIHPGAVEVCGNGIDEDCDGIDPPCACQDDLDNDGHISIECGGDDCCDTGADPSLGCTDTTAPDINPNGSDICGNGVDENCDGFDALCGPAAMSRPARDTITPVTVRNRRGLPLLRVNGARSRLGRVKVLAGGDPVYLVAVLGDDAFALSNNSGLKTSEVCMVGDDGHLAADCGTGVMSNTNWVIQDAIPAPNPPNAHFGHDALLYFDYLYSFVGLSSETIDPLARSINGGNINRFPIEDVTALTDVSELLLKYESANTNVNIDRAYYKSLRLLSYIYMVGGWTSGGPTDTIERHLQ